MFSWFRSLFGAKNVEIAAADSLNFHEGLEAMDEGNACFLAKDFNAALAHYDKAIEEHIQDGYNQRAICLQALNRHLEALNDFDRAIAASPQDCNIYFTRAVSRIKVCDNAGAICDMRIAVELSQVKSELNNIYNEARIKSGEFPLHDFYTIQLLGIESLARFNEQQKKLGF